MFDVIIFHWLADLAERLKQSRHEDRRRQGRTAWNVLWCFAVFGPIIGISFSVLGGVSWLLHAIDWALDLFS